jgi:hypothetical protein
LAGLVHASVREVDEDGEGRPKAESVVEMEIVEGWLKWESWACVDWWSEKGRKSMHHC